MVGAVEGHVLEEVGETALVLVLLERTHLLRDVEIGAVLRPIVVTDDVGQSVGQLADAESRVHWYRY